MNAVWSPPRSPDGQRHRGFTFVELTVSMAVSSVLIVGVSSTITVAGRGVELAQTTAGDPVQQTTSDTLTDDLRFALDFTERTATTVAFTVPDRNGDGFPDTIRYAWSGVTGDPLTKTVNGGTPIVVVESVSNVDFGYEYETIEGSAAPAPVENAELELMAHDDAPGVGSFGSKPFDDAKYVAQYVRPTLPENALWWKATRVALRLRATGDFELSPPGTIFVELRRALDEFTPDKNVLASFDIAEATLTETILWLHVDPLEVTDLDPAEGLFIVVRGEQVDGHAGKIEHESVELGQEHLMTPNTHYVESTDGGKSWDMPDYPDRKDLRFYLYGTVTTMP